MIDNVLEELWNTKDSIARDYGYSIDGLAKYYLKKQDSRNGYFYQHNKKATTMGNKKHFAREKFCPETDNKTASIDKP